MSSEASDVKQYLLRLFNEDILQEEFLRFYNIRLRFADIGVIPGFTYSEGGNRYIFINVTLPVEIQRMVFLHELDHVLRIPNSLYVVNIDKLDSYWEIAAERFVKEVRMRLKMCSLK